MMNQSNNYDHMVHYITCDNKEFMTMIPVPEELTNHGTLEDIKDFIFCSLSGTECGIKYLIEIELAWYEIPPCTEVDEIPEDYFDVFEEDDDDFTFTEEIELPFD